jgi:non-specific protein-tyrosine kinase
VNLIDYARILWRRGWIMLILAIIAAASAYALSTQQQAVYRASQRVLIQPTRPDNGLTIASRTLLGNHVAYLNSEFRAQEIIDRLQLDMTPPQLKGVATITQNQNDLTIQIDIDMADPGLAGSIAREWGVLLIEYRNAENNRARREDHINASLQDNASIGLLRPRPTINAAAGAVLGVLLGGVIIFLLEYLESSVVRSRDDLERNLAMPVLAAIPEEAR